MTRCTPSGNCHGNCNEGRNCFDSLVSTRRVLGLNQSEGGRTADGGNVLYSPEEVEGWVMPTVVTIVVFAVAIFAAVAWLGAAMVIPFGG